MVESVTERAGLPLFVPRALAGAERMLTNLARQIARPWRTLGSRALSFVDRLTASWTSRRSERRNSRFEIDFPMIRPWYLFDEDEDDLLNPDYAPCSTTTKTERVGPRQLLAPERRERSLGSANAAPFVRSPNRSTLDFSSALFDRLIHSESARPESSAERGVEHSLGSANAAPFVRSPNRSTLDLSSALFDRLIHSESARPERSAERGVEGRDHRRVTSFDFGLAPRSLRSGRADSKITKVSAYPTGIDGLGIHALEPLELAGSPLGATLSDFAVSVPSTTPAHLMAPPMRKVSSSHPPLLVHIASLDQEVAATRPVGMGRRSEAFVDPLVRRSDPMWSPSPRPQSRAETLTSGALHLFSDLSSELRFAELGFERWNQVHGELRGSPSNSTFGHALVQPEAKPPEAQSDASMAQSLRGEFTLQVLLLPEPGSAQRGVDGPKHYRDAFFDFGFASRPFRYNKMLPPPHSARPEQGLAERARRRRAPLAEWAPFDSGIASRSLHLGRADFSISFPTVTAVHPVSGRADFRANDRALVELFSLERAGPKRFWAPAASQVDEPPASEWPAPTRVPSRGDLRGTFWSQVVDSTATYSVEEARVVFESGQDNGSNDGTQIGFVDRLGRSGGRSGVRSEMIESGSHFISTRPATSLPLISSGGSDAAMNPAETSASARSRTMAPLPVVSSSHASLSEASRQIWEVLRAQSSQPTVNDDRLSLADLTLISIASANEQMAASPSSGGALMSDNRNHTLSTSGQGASRTSPALEEEDIELDELARRVFDEFRRRIAIQHERSGDRWER